MKILFLDDSYQSYKDNRYLGYGGFCIEADRIKELTAGLSRLKTKYEIPDDVNLKWSPDPKHFLRTDFKGKRHDLYADILTLLRDNGAEILCTVHHLDSCYGVRLHNWGFKRTRLWATKQQCKFIAERFEIVCLDGQTGLIIADHYSDVEGETSLIKEIGIDFQNGTNYCSFNSLCIPPLTATPNDCTPIQCADIVVGIIVAAISGSKYGIALFEDVARMFVLNPYKDASTFTVTFSTAALGWGLKLFPSDFAMSGWGLFMDFDKNYTYTSEQGLVLKQDG
jgi:hypothetical protein